MGACQAHQALMFISAIIGEDVWMCPNGSLVLSDPVVFSRLSPGVESKPIKGSYDCDQGVGNWLVPSRRKVALTEPKLTTSPFWSNSGLSGVNVKSPSRVLFRLLRSSR